MRFIDTEGGDAEAYILQDLDKNPADAEHHYWTEYRIAHHPHHRLDPALDHLGDDHAINLGIGFGGASPLDQGGVTIPDRLLIIDVQQYTADLGLMR